MPLARRTLLTSLLVLVVVTGCSKQEAAPELGLPALTLHVCLAQEPTGQGPCSDEALASACPPAADRDQCRQEALDQIAAADEYEPAADDGLGTAGIVITAGATMAFFAVLGLVLTRRHGRRNLEAYERELPTLADVGFLPIEVPVPLSVAAPHNEGRERARRVLRRREPSPAMWLYETEVLAEAVNGLPPTRWSFTAGPDVDQATLDASLHAHVDPDGPLVGAWLGEGQLVLWTRVPPRRSSKRPAPLSLLGLAELHEAVLDDLRETASR